MIHGQRVQARRQYNVTGNGLYEPPEVDLEINLDLWLVACPGTPADSRLESNLTIGPDLIPDTNREETLIEAACRRLAAEPQS